MTFPHIYIEYVNWIELKWMVQQKYFDQFDLKKRKIEVVLNRWNLQQRSETVVICRYWESVLFYIKCIVIAKANRLELYGTIHSNFFDIDLMNLSLFDVCIAIKTRLNEPKIIERKEDWKRSSEKIVSFFRSFNIEDAFFPTRLWAHPFLLIVR